jgi:hypothetical protein
VATAIVASFCACAPSQTPDAEEVVAPERFWDVDLACDDGGRPYAVALTRAPDGAVRFFFAAARSGGETWEVADPAPFGVAERGRRRPRLAAGRDGEIYCLWEDARSGPIDLYFNRSDDGGTTWLAEDLRLNTNAAGTSHLAAPAIACDDVGRVYAVWRDNREGFDAFYSNASRNAGATWRASDVRVTGIIGFGRKDEPRLACDSFGNVYLAWVEERDGGTHVYFNASLDGGDSWMLQDIWLGDGGRVFAADLVAMDTGVVLVAWSETGQGGERVFVARSTDRGRVWDTPRPLRVAQLRPDASPPRIVSDRRDHVYVAWHATGSDNMSRIAVASSSDAGGRFEFNVARLPSLLEEPDPYGPRRGLQAPFDIDCDESGNVYLSWTEPGAGLYRVGIDRMSGFGRIWLQLPTPMGLDAYPPALPAPPQLACDDFGHVYLLWNAGHVLHTAASPFYAESGWRHQSF